ncbi:MAG: hypothetical protein V2I97_01960 [Desulfococcaceae bacterium]|jgi:hypothetical protein|nr:hypothetical protein [Desulfococcaceae bacterium]
MIKKKRISDMKKIILVLLLIFSLFLCGCGGGKAKEIYDTAQLEELQNNPEHARRLYAEIMEKYPDSEFARKAGERLKTLDK